MGGRFCIRNSDACRHTFADTLEQFFIRRQRVLLLVGIHDAPADLYLQLAIRKAHLRRDAFSQQSLPEPRTCAAKIASKQAATNLNHVAHLASACVFTIFIHSSYISVICF